MSLSSGDNRIHFPIFARWNGRFQNRPAFAMSAFKRLLLILCFAGLISTLYGQNIFTIAGVPYGHRKAVDGQPALTAPLDSSMACFSITRQAGCCFTTERWWSVSNRIVRCWHLSAVVNRKTAQRPTAHWPAISGSRFCAAWLRTLPEISIWPMPGRAGLSCGSGWESIDLRRRRNKAGLQSDGGRQPRRNSFAARNGVRFERRPEHRRNFLRLYSAGFPGRNYLNPLHGVRLRPVRDRSRVWASTRKTIST